MKAALSTTIRPSSLAAQLAYIVAFALVLLTLMFAGLLASAPAPSPVVNPPMPTIVPADYRLPAVRVNYADPNYIGSYGG